MIQVYSPGNEDFTKNGDCTLLPETAGVHAVLSGTWSAELVHPIDAEGRWRYLVYSFFILVFLVNQFYQYVFILGFA